MLPATEKIAEAVAIDDEFNALATLHPQKVYIVGLRLFSGLSVEETAEVLGVAPVVVIREWDKARA